MIIYSYYQSISQSNQNEEFACANEWKRSWEANGWNCQMLNRSHSQCSTMYNKLQQKLMTVAKGLPSDLLVRFDWIVARYVRWCALHAAGGGWMVDYDVVNKSFKPTDAESKVKNDTLYVNHDALAYLFYASKEHAENVIKIFIQEPICEGNLLLKEYDILKSAKLGDILHKVHHVKSSDMKRSEQMQKMIDGKTVIVTPETKIQGARIDLEEPIKENVFVPRKKNKKNT